MNTSDVILSKIVIIGNSAVGKTSICLRYLKDKFSDDYNITLGAEYILRDQKMIGNQDLAVRFQLWDLSGQEKFAGIRNLYYPGAVGVIIVYDITRPSTFYDIDFWINEIAKNLGNNISQLTLVGNKVDLRDEAIESVSKTEGEKLAGEIQRKLGVSTHFFETSALSGKNIQSLFHQLARSIADRDAAGKSLSLVA